MNKKSAYGTVSLPLPLIDAVKKKIEGTGMHSVSSYICFILRQILSSQKSEDKTPLDKKTEEEIRSRLEKLGYI